MTRKLGSSGSGESPKIVVRLSDELYGWLNSYCRIVSRKRSDAIRAAIERMVDDYPYIHRQESVVERSPLYGDDVDVHQEQVGEGAQPSQPKAKARHRKTRSQREYAKGAKLRAKGPKVLAVERKRRQREQQS